MRTEFKELLREFVIVSLLWVIPSSVVGGVAYLLSYSRLPPEGISDPWQAAFTTGGVTFAVPFVILLVSCLLACVTRAACLRVSEKK